MSSPYRSDQETLRDRLDSLSLRVAELEGRYTQDFWDLLAPDLGLQPPGVVDIPDEASAKALESIVAEVEQRLELLETLEGDLERVERLWGEPSPEPPAFTTFSSDINTLIEAPFMFADKDAQTFRELLEDFFPDATVESLGKRDLGCRAVLDGVPFTVTYHSRVNMVSNTWDGSANFSTTVPRGTAEVAIYEQGVVESIRQVFRLTSDVSVGNAEFDRTALIRGDAETARAMLTPEVQRQLLELSRQELPEIRVVRGIAILSWSWKVSERVLNLALDILEGMREAAPTPTRPFRKA